MKNNWVADSGKFGMDTQEMPAVAENMIFNMLVWVKNIILQSIG